MPRSIKKQFPKIFADWHPTLNGRINPSLQKKTSRKKYWWKCHSKKCGHNWQATINARINLGDTCPKCKERKKKKFTQDLLEIKKIFKRIKQLHPQIDKCIDIFTDDTSTKASKQRSAVSARRKIEEINSLGLRFRKIILNYRKKMIGYNIEKKLNNKKDEQ